MKFVEQVEDFAETYGLILKKKYQPTDSSAPGTIIRQNRVAGSKIVPDVELIITIAEEIVIPEEEEEEIVGEDSSSGEEDTSNEDIEGGVSN